MAPLHNPANIAGIQAAREVLPGVPQVAECSIRPSKTMPDRAYRYAMPAAWYERYSVRRYVFMVPRIGMSLKNVPELLDLAPDNHGIITAHLGNGCSACAVRNGKSVDTTMGLTPLAGLVMGTRSGDIDPGIIDYVVRKLAVAWQRIQRL